MHRHRPFTMRNRGKGTATTKIRPHSLYEMRRSAAYERRYARALPRYEAFIASGKKRRRKAKYITAVEVHQEKWSTRPILRDELYNELMQRLSPMLVRKLGWHTTRAAGERGRLQDKLEELSPIRRR